MESNILVEKTADYIHPDHFIKGEAYLLWERHFYQAERVPETVHFVGYAPCPAILVVQDSRQHRFFAARANLYTWKT